MTESASQRLIRLHDKIMQTWEDRACEEVSAATHQNSLALRNSLPEFLNQMASALSTNIDRTKARVKWDLNESTRIGQKHGRERAKMNSYTMDQLIFEYHILRQVVCDVMEAEAPLSPEEREIIVCAVEQAVNDAATQFSKSLRDVQEQFTQTLAHDLRSPITGARLCADLILKKPAEVENTVKLGKRIISTMERLDLMIHDLLDAGKLRNGESLKLETVDCDLEIIVKEIGDETNFLYENRVKIQTQGATNGKWNPESLRRIIDNLMTNALKFSGPGTPITLKLQKQDHMAVLSVQNFGKLILAEDLPILFEQYKRSRDVENKQGWGLGLSVVKGLTEAHCGTVEVISTPETGTIFTVLLPLGE